MISPCVESFVCSEDGFERGGLAAAEEKKNEDDTEGSDDTDSEGDWGGLSGEEGKATE